MSLLFLDLREKVHGNFHKRTGIFILILLIQQFALLNLNEQLPLGLVFVVIDQKVVILFEFCEFLAQGLFVHVPEFLPRLNENLVQLVTQALVIAIPVEFIFVHILGLKENVVLN